MATSFYTTLSGMKANQTEMEFVAQNLANVSTPGYRESKVSFSSLLSRFQNTGSSEKEKTSYAGKGQSYLNTNVGEYQYTNNNLDVAIQGKGFFEIQTDNGIAYSRAGNFSISPSGELVTMQGYRIMGDGGAIQVGGGGNIQITKDGTLNVDGQAKGRIKIVEFENPDQMQSLGGSLFQSTESPKESVGSQLLQGQVEASNTNVMANLVRLIEISKEYQTYQKTLSAQQKLDEQAASNVGRIA